MPGQNYNGANYILRSSAQAPYNGLFISRCSLFYLAVLYCPTDLPFAAVSSSEGSLGPCLICGSWYTLHSSSHKVPVAGTIGPSSVLSPSRLSLPDPNGAAGRTTNMLSSPRAVPSSHPRPYFCYEALVSVGSALSSAGAHRWLQLLSPCRGVCGGPHKKETSGLIAEQPP